MRDPWKPMLYTMLLLITFLVICNYTLANEPKSKWLNENPCMIKVVIKETEKCQDSQCLLPKITVTCSDSADALAVAICHAHYSRVDLKFGSTNEKTLDRKSKTATSNRMNDLINRALIKEALR